MDRRDFVKGGIVGLVGAMLSSPGRALSSDEERNLMDVSRAAQDLREFTESEFSRGKPLSPETFREFSELIIKLIGE